MRRFIALSAILPAILLAPETAVSQEAQDSSTTGLLVFSDCHVHNCDYDHLRRQIPWVNWVRDRLDAEVHLLVTSERTGGGGTNYTLDYIGREDFLGVNKTLTYTSNPDATDSEVRDGLTSVIALGLVSYVENSPILSQLRIESIAEDAGAAEVAEEDDPWNLWTFRVGGDLSFEGESQQREYQVEGDFSADRVAEDFKVEFEFDAEYDREEFDEIDTGTGILTTDVSTIVDWDTRAFAAWSINSHWSAGGFAEAERSFFENKDVEFATGPAIEYNIFPWSESTRRQATLRYAVEFVYFDFHSTSVDSLLTASRARHSLEFAVDVQQPWGEIFGSIEGTQYFQDLATHRIETFVFLEYRLFRGFSIDLFAEFDRIKDQFFLPFDPLSTTDILRQRRQRETDYRYDVGFGFSYRFGSRFANVVNPRLD
jgi:hypothetical protein